VEEVCTVDQRGDIRDLKIVETAVKNAEPDVVVHLAAQPLVLDSYKRPRWTVETNVMGTLNVLEAVGSQGNVKALLVVTTDKVYRNLNQRKAYLETDPLGGDDLYSSSKAMADILTHSWAKSFPGTRTAVARAGNVIGGGDVSSDRLIPDIVSNMRSGTDPVLRHPEAVRPWQHVLDCLNGYQLLIDALLTKNEDFNFEGGWNFGPALSSFVTVGEVASKAISRWGSSGTWSTDASQKPHEAKILALDSARAKSELSWNNKLTFEQAVTWTIDWYKELGSAMTLRHFTNGQIEEFRQWN
jgi:CDP-glucose 4,6-dehydratase